MLNKAINLLGVMALLLILAMILLGCENPTEPQNAVKALTDPTKPENAVKALTEAQTPVKPKDKYEGVACSNPKFRLGQVVTQVLDGSKVQINLVYETVDVENGSCVYRVSYSTPDSFNDNLQLWEFQLQ